MSLEPASIHFAPVLEKYGNHKYELGINSLAINLPQAGMQDVINDIHSMGYRTMYIGKYDPTPNSIMQVTVLRK